LSTAGSTAERATASAKVPRVIASDIKEEALKTLSNCEWTRLDATNEGGCRIIRHAGAV
jgi:hypothetical protein